MSEVEYRDLLGSVGAASSTELTQAGFKQVMEHFESLGFKKKKKTRKPLASKALLTGKVKALIITMDLTMKYANGIAKRMFGIDQIGWCNADQLRRVVAALMYKKKGMNVQHRTSNVQHRMKKP
jgi:phage gp16-like protein